MRINALKTRLALSVSTAVCGFATVSHAAETPEAPVIEEITVTARYRKESLQQVPISVTAFSAKTLEDAGVRQYGDFVALSPNVSLAKAESAGQSFLTIRGLTQVRNSEAPVAFVIDGVQTVSNKQFTQELFDLQSIQVLKGPQGALYGRNAAGGAIIVTTKQPTNEFEGHIKLSAGEAEEYGAQAVVSGPIIEDKLLFRLAAGYVDRDGYFDNVYLDRTADPYSDKTFRGLLKWQASDNFETELRLNSVRTKSGVLNYQFQSVLFDAANPCFTDLSNPFGGPATDPNRVSRDFCANNRGDNTRDLDEATLKASYQLPFGTLSGIFSYNTIEEYAAGDQFPYTASRNTFGFADNIQTQYIDITARSTEVRLTSNSDQRFRWMFGGYYLSLDRFISTAVGLDNGLGMQRIERNPAFASTLSPTLTYLADNNDNSSRALFGNVAYDLLDDLELSLALRYDKDERDQSIDPRSTAGVPAGCTFATLDLCDRSASFDRVQPKGTLRYEFSDQMQAYASWGRGFRSGEFNQYGSTEAAATVGIVGVTDLVGAEYTESTELGFKSSFLDNRLRVNAALFDSTVEGQQIFVFIAALGAQELINIDKVKIRGGELEIVASPLPGLDLYASAGVSDSEIKRYRLDPAAVGNWAPYVPQTSYNAGAQYRFALSSRLDVLTRADYIIKGSQYWDPQNSQARDAIHLLNLRVGLEDADAKWSLTGTLANALDEEYNEEYVLGGFAQPALPRVWRIEARYNF